MSGWVAAIGAGVAAAGSVAGGMLAKSGGDAAAGATAQASADANRIAENQQRENRSDTSPWRAAGTSALSQIGKLMGWGDLYNPGGTGATYDYTGDASGAKKAQALNEFTTSPGYQFRLGEGIKALDRSASSRGRLMSGAQIKGVQGFGEGLASDEYGSYMNQLMGLAGLGQGGTGQLVGSNTGLASGSAGNTLQGGIARGSAYSAGANALASGLGSGINNAIGGYYLGNYLNRLPGTKPYGGTAP